MSTKSTRSFCQKLVWQKNSGGSSIQFRVLELSDSSFHQCSNRIYISKATSDRDLAVCKIGQASVIDKQMRVIINLT